MPRVVQGDRARKKSPLRTRSVLTELEQVSVLTELEQVSVLTKLEQSSNRALFFVRALFSWVREGSLGERD
jgi:hypothetical protein